MTFFKKIHTDYFDNCKKFTNLAENKKTVKELGIFMNVMTDFGFKRMFGSEEFKHVLIRFLNVLFAPENVKVDNVKYHNKEVLPPNPDGKRIVYDVYCTTLDEKQHFILEMQQEHHTHFDKRMVYLRLMIVCLEEVKETWEECETELEKITYLIKNMHKMDKESEAYKCKEYEDMFNAAEIGDFAAEEVVAYSKSVRAYEDRELYRESGYSDGFEEGKEEGREEGKKETSRKMRDVGIDAELIRQITDYGPSEY